MSEDLPAGAVAGAAGTWPGGTWESALTCQGFTAVRGVGFEPVGQVFGAAVHAAGYASGYSCPGAWESAGDRRPTGPPAQVSGRRDAGSFEPLVEAMYQARQTAINRMTAECAALGGHGVVGVRLARGRCPSAGWISRPPAPRFARRVPGAGSGRSSPATSPGRISPS